MSFLVKEVWPECKGGVAYVSINPNKGDVALVNVNPSKEVCLL